MSKKRGPYQHPIFARVYVMLSALAEGAGVAEHRRDLLAGVRGVVVEVGSGAGSNFSHYPPEVSEVIAIEPDAHLRERSELAARGAPVRVKVLDATADSIPLANESADTVVFSLVLCSVSSPRRALAEAKRLLRPGGELRLYEHVRASEKREARLQDRIDVVWPHLAGGCHCNRNTEASILEAGFTVDRVTRLDFRPLGLRLPISPHIIATASFRPT